MGGFITAAIIIAVLTLIMLMPISLHVLVSYSDEGAGVDFNIKYGPLRLTAAMSEIKEKASKNRGGAEEPENRAAKHNKRKKSFKENFEFIRLNIDDIKELIYAVLNYLFKRLIKIKKLSVELILGLDDAMNTALVYGAAAAFIYNAVGVMDKKMRLGRHSENVLPDFNNPHIFAELEAIISTNIFHAAVLGLIALRHGVGIYRKYRRN